LKINGYYLKTSIPGILGIPLLVAAAISTSFIFVAFSMALLRVTSK
jgi:hypothetical protein